LFLNLYVRHVLNIGILSVSKLFDIETIASNDLGLKFIKADVLFFHLYT